MDNSKRLETIIEILSEQIEQHCIIEALENNQTAWKVIFFSINNI